MARSMVYATAQLASPQWAGDYGNRDHLIPGGAKLDAAQFTATDAVTATVTAAGAAGGATSIPVTALTGPIPNGTVLKFAPGANKYAKLTAAAATGATALTVEAIPTALVLNDAAVYGGVEKKTVLSGTPVGRTIAERDASTAFGPAVDTDDEIYLLYHDITDVADINDAVLYRHNSIVKENYVPGWTGLPLALKTKLRSLYRCTRGAD